MKAGIAAASVRRTSSVALPLVAGVPLKRPLLASVRPLGSVPEATIHEYGGVPPPAVKL